MEEWKVYKIKDICKGIYEGPHATPKESQTGGIYLGIPAISVDGHINFRNAKRIAEEDLPLWTKRVTPQEDDIVFTNEATLNLYALIPAGFHGCLGRRLGLVRPNNEIVNAKYLFYYFFSPEWRNVISQNKVYGATVERILMTKFPSFPIKLPSLSVQNSIVNILSSLDDKIEVNRRINENLEQQAQAMFKSWFVDFEPFKDGEFVESELGMIPEGWKVVSLDDMTSKFGTGLNPRKNFKLGEGNNYYVTIKNMGNNRVYLDDKCDKVTDEAIEKINKRSKLQEGDLLFSGIGTIGRVALITETPTNWNTSESVFNMHPAKNISSEFLYVLLLSDIFQQYVKIRAQGGVQQGIRMASLKEYRMALPEDFLLRKFDDIVMPIISKIKNNDNQSDSLAELRDALLPKLMSGELKVNEVEI